MLARDHELTRHGFVMSPGQQAYGLRRRSQIGPSVAGRRRVFSVRSGNCTKTIADPVMQVGSTAEQLSASNSDQTASTSLQPIRMIAPVIASTQPVNIRR